MIKNFISLTKPGIIFGNVITAIGGFALASKGEINFLLFVETLLGLSLVIASACVFNNCIDKEIDAKMARTKKRPLAVGLIPVFKAIGFGGLLAVAGGGILAFFTNWVAFSLAFVGLLIYVGPYSLCKYWTSHGTLIGSVAGGIPPTVGYCAVSNTLDGAAGLLFLIVSFWQMPHFFSIAIYRLEDYAAASIPVLPLKNGILATKRHMLFYIVAFICCLPFLFLLGYTGMGSVVVAALIGSFWLFLCIQGFGCSNDRLWARHMFFFSLLVIPVFCLLVSMDAVR